MKKKKKMIKKKKKKKKMKKKKKKKNNPKYKYPLFMVYPLRSLECVIKPKV